MSKPTRKTITAWRELLRRARASRSSEVELFVPGRARFERIGGARLAIGECVRLIEDDAASPYVRLTSYSHCCGEPGVWAVIEANDLEDYLDKKGTP